MSVLATRIKERREQMELTQADLASLSQSTQKQIWLYESGKGEPSVSKLLVIAKVLKTSPDYLLGISDQVYPHYDDSNLDTKERELLKIYRGKPRDKQESILAMAQVI